MVRGSLTTDGLPDLRTNAVSAPAAGMSHALRQWQVTGFPTLPAKLLHPRSLAGIKVQADLGGNFCTYQGLECDPFVFPLGHQRL